MIWIFWEMTSGIISVLSTLWFDSGYMYGVSLRGFLDVFHTIFHVKWTFGDGFELSPYSALSLVRQQKHMHCVSSRSF